MDVFIRDLIVTAETGGFRIHNLDSMAMAQTFRSHDQPVEDGFDLHMVQLCKPAKAARSLQGNPERAVLMPKFIIAFSRDNMTQVRFLSYAGETVRQMVDDDTFPASLSESYDETHALITRACGESPCGIS